ncbi:unnamed protein product [Trifolium pratense]|uniref:Uncharacterized protein n=1 Tax=Trifolium pratense TaxID=57577 RepID=A0ACB0IQF2_TRIPR|nr:unnamed protein product [Trifolium pratense]
MDIVTKLDNFDDKKEDEIVLPGFRFHPTDEELVGFYLRRKVDKKSLRIELIKQIDIYKYDPWDLPTSSMGEKECYFFCLRGRKYRNSIRPNRVTGSGFWKATGIDKPIYSSSVKESSSHDCIGLKKSLVYYRGSAGKGTKTDWMMHEFRLPPKGKTSNNQLHNLSNDVQEAEVWTLCRIFKRIPSYKKYTPNLKKDSEETLAFTTNSSSSKTCSLESDNTKPYLTFTNSPLVDETKTFTNGHVDQRINPSFLSHHLGNVSHQAPTTLSQSSFWNDQNVVDEAFANENWDDLRSVVQFTFDPSKVYDCKDFN